jgi:hypothetical protein
MDIIYPYNLDDNEKNAIFEYVKKAYNLIQQCAMNACQKGQICVRSKDCTMGYTFYLLSAFVMAQRALLKTPHNVSKVYRSQTKLFTGIQLCNSHVYNQRFTSCVLEEEFGKIGNFGSFKYEINIPKETPVIMIRSFFQGKQFTEVVLPPGIFKIERQCNATNVGLLTYVESVKMNTTPRSIQIETPDISKYCVSGSPTRSIDSILEQFKELDDEIDWDNLEKVEIGGGVQKVFYKGYYYKVRRSGKKQFIVTKNEGNVSLAKALKWKRVNKKTI